MAEVEVTVNARTYKITCENGQESRLVELSRYLDRHLTELADSLGQIGETRLLLLSALTMCDELFETRAQLTALQDAQNEMAPDTESGALAAIDAARDRVDAATQRLLEIN